MTTTKHQEYIVDFSQSLGPQGQIGPIQVTVLRAVLNEGFAAEKTAGLVGAMSVYSIDDGRVVGFKIPAAPEVAQQIATNFADIDPRIVVRDAEDQIVAPEAPTGRGGEPPKAGQAFAICAL